MGHNAAIMMEQDNGLQIKSWSDVVAVATLLAMFLACVAWGLKLEGELNVIRDDLSIVRQQVGNGILPRAEERVNALQRSDTRLERRIDRLEKMAEDR